MNASARAVLAVFAGLGGAVAIFLLFVSGVTHPCLAASLRPWDDIECEERAAGIVDVLLPTVPVGGLVVVALLHVWLLKMVRQPRPWSVVVPGVLLVVALEAVAASIHWGSDRELLVLLPIPAAVLTAAFALAGVVTGFGPWWAVLGDRALALVAPARYRGRRDRTEHRGQDG
ncbi:hypothetical protein [Lentzea sp.]|uniref:hypothetical protein n=1 Tax=Lentzea sp. TaxID=56099 RepID=UPI002C6BEFD3|nr:hypothetical protein [Lentzea sp.]HUQ60394.1 hypothetical protein [Lentzea sp.]